jgi:cobyrinic acid a,c-diamide synthase
MALIIAGERSGVGKTTMTLALFAALKQRGLKVQSFKVGPDYIDPMFHQHITGLPCRNLDAVLTSEAYIQQCFADHIQSVDYAIVEGVMGLFDGASGQHDQASTAHIARSLRLPIVLVLDCRHLSGSIAAIVHGYRTFDSRLQIAGVILNRVGSDRHLQLLTDALEPLEMPILGVVRRQDDITIPDRHLGLVPTAELAELDTILQRLAYLGETCFDWTRLLPLLAVENPPQSPLPRGDLSTLVPPLRRGGRGDQNPGELTSGKKVRIAIAHDRAFSFYYADNLELLAALGAELMPWSPLQDTRLPEGVQGLYFGGGFPELFAAELAANAPAQAAVKAVILSGIPTYAECGGLMYLCEQIVDFQNQPFPMVGVLPTTAVMDAQLTLGYRRAIALQESPIVSKGSTLWGHEFHRSRLSTYPQLPLFQLQGYDANTPISYEGWQMPQLHASYVHLHWGTCPERPARFLAQCAQTVKKIYPW